MINREPLKKGTKLYDKYVIGDKIGEGASCLVYEARSNEESLPGSHITYRRIIKECFPLSNDLSRNSQGAIVGDTDNDNAFAAEKKRFEMAYERTADLRNQKSLTNYIVEAIGIFTENNTVYSVFGVSEGSDYERSLQHSFENSTYGNLSDVFKLFIDISKVIYRFHEAGMLCLDIKPQNIFIEEDTEKIKILDFDSFVTQSEAKDRSLEYISFSKGFAAPEQLRGERNQISERTDIYAIGAMLYYALFGDKYDCVNEINDEDIPYNQMKYPEYQPDFIDELKVFFSKTLAIWPEDRYANVEELIDQLKALMDYSIPLHDVLIHDALNSYSSLYRPKIKGIYDELNHIPANVSDAALPRYLYIARILAKKSEFFTLNSAKHNQKFLTFLVKTYSKDIEYETASADDLCLSMWALYQLSENFNDTESAKQLEILFDFYCDKAFKSTCVNIIADYITEKVASLNENDILEFMEKIAVTILPELKQENQTQIFKDSRQKSKLGSYNYTILTLFYAVLIDSKGECRFIVDESSSDEETIPRSAEYLSQSMESYDQYGIKDYFLENSIKFVIEKLGFKVDLFPQGYDADKAEKDLKNRYPNLMSYCDQIHFSRS